jgi:hypothetical protein
MAVEGNGTVIAISVIQLLVTIAIIVFCVQSCCAHHSRHGCVVIISDINIVGVWIHVVEMVTESGDSHAREHAKDVALMFCEFYNTIVIRKRYTMNIVGYVPGGASRQNCSRSERRNACTPVKLRWVSFWQLLRSVRML